MGTHKFIVDIVIDDIMSTTPGNQGFYIQGHDLDNNSIKFRLSRRQLRDLGLMHGYLFNAVLFEGALNGKTIAFYLTIEKTRHSYRICTTQIVKNSQKQYWGNTQRVLPLDKWKRDRNINITFEATFHNKTSTPLFAKNLAIQTN